MHHFAKKAKCSARKIFQAEKARARAITGAHWVQGIAGSALEFKNTSTCVNMKRSPDGLAGNTEFTVSFWVKINTWPSAQYAYLVLFGSNAFSSQNDVTFHVLLDNDGSIAPFGTVRANFWNRHVYTAHTFTTGIWYNWAFVYDKTEIKMYQNGTWLEDISLGGASPNIDASGILRLSNPTGQPFDGILDELAIYNNSRTAADIYNDYINMISNHSIVLTPHTGFASTTIVGSGFSGDSRVTFTWDGTTIPSVPSPVTTDTTGSFVALISVTTQAAPGAHIVTATDELGKWATATFTVLDMTGSQGSPGENQLILIAFPTAASILALCIAVVALLRKRS